MCLPLRCPFRSTIGTPTGGFPATSWSFVAHERPLFREAGAATSRPASPHWGCSSAHLCRICRIQPPNRESRPLRSRAFSIRRFHLDEPDVPSGTRAKPRRILQLGRLTGGIWNLPRPSHGGCAQLKVAPSREHGGRHFSFRVAGMNTTNASLNESPIPIRKEDFGKIIPVIRSGIEIRRDQIPQSQRGHFNPQHSPKKKNRLVSSPCSHMAHSRFYSAHCSHPATAPGAAQACPLCLPSGSNQRTCGGHPRLGRPVEKSFRFAFRTSQLGSFIPGTARFLPSLSRIVHIPDHAVSDRRTCETGLPICHFAVGVCGFPTPAIRFGQIGAPVMTTSFRVVHLNGPAASLPIQFNVLTSAPADSLRLLDVLSLMSVPCSGRQELRPLAPPLLTGPAHQLTCPGYAGGCRPIERAVRSASVPSQFGCLTFLHPAFRPAPVRKVAPIALICGHCSGRRARRFLGPSAFADAANQRSFPDLSGSLRPFSPSSHSPKPQLRTQRKGVGIPFDHSIGVFGNPLQDSSIHRPRPVWRVSGLA